MRITKYKTELNENRQNILIKESEINYPTQNLSNPKEIVNMLNDCFNLNKLAEEHTYLIGFSTTLKPLGVFEVSHGNVNSSIITPREIFIRLLLCGASRFVLAHNHPSGNTTPSKEDIEIKNRIKTCSSIIGIELVDFIIIGDEYISFQEKEFI